MSLPAENARSVAIHSSNPQLVYLPRRENNKIFRVIPQTINHLPICVKAFVPTQQRVKVNCTDVNTGELVHSWLLIIDASQPTVSKTEQVYVRLGHFSNQQLRFTNKLALATVYEFASSDESIVVPKVKMQKYDSREANMIDLRFMPLHKLGTYKVFIYANDIDHNVVECYCLNVLCI